MAIDTLANVKTHLGVTGTADDAVLTTLQAAADAFVDGYCGRTFTGGTFVEFHPGGGRWVFLRNFPVTGVVSVQVDPDEAFGPETTRPATSYTVHADRGVIVSKTGPFVPSRPGFAVGPDDFPRAVRMEYTTAAGTAPAAVGRAYAELIGHWFRQAKTQAYVGQLDVLSKPEASGGFTTYPYGLSGGFKVPVGVLAVLNLYRVPAA
jgi:hypothetical protein